MSSTTIQLKVKCLKVIHKRYPAFNNMIYNDYDWKYDYNNNAIVIDRKFDSGFIEILSTHSGQYPMDILESIVEDTKVNKLLGISFEDYYEGLVNAGVNS